MGDKRITDRTGKGYEEIICASTGDSNSVFRARIRRIVGCREGP